MTSILAANWKMNQSLGEIEAFFSALKPQWNQLYSADTRVIIGCPFIYLPRACELAKEMTPGLQIASQNTWGEQSGAFTGEVSVPMLKEFGIDVSIIGHSERRHVFGESNELIAKRAAGILSQNSKVIFCVGETLEERKTNLTQQTLRKQLAWLKELQDLSILNDLTLAYEPVWAIGTGETATPEIADESHGWIQQILAEIFYEKKCAPISILYGGSVKPANFKSLLTKDNISGGLVGGASLKAESFMQLLEIAHNESKAKRS